MDTSKQKLQVVTNLEKLYGVLGEMMESGDKVPALYFGLFKKNTLLMYEAICAWEEMETKPCVEKKSQEDSCDSIESKEEPDSEEQIKAQEAIEAFPEETRLSEEDVDENIEETASPQNCELLEFLEEASFKDEDQEAVDTEILSLKLLGLEETQEKEDLEGLFAGTYGAYEEVSMSQESMDERDKINRQMFLEEFGAPESFLESISNLEDAQWMQPSKEMQGIAVSRTAMPGSPILNKIRDNKDAESMSSLAAKFKTPQTLNDKFQQGETKNIYYAASSRAIDLKSAIGINEKFLFINELFKGNMKECTDFIIRVNEAGSLGNALEILKPVKEEYAWEEGSKAFVTLKEFIERRFPA